MIGMKKEPLIDMPLEDFLKPIFIAYAKSGIHMSFNRIENDTLYLNINKRACGG